MTDSRRITLYQPHLTHVLEAVAFEPHLLCIYYRCLQRDSAHSHKPAGFWFPRDCQWDSRSYKWTGVTDLHWEPLSFCSAFFSCVSPSSYNHAVWSIVWISFIRYISYVSSIHLLSICKHGADRCMHTFLHSSSCGTAPYKKKNGYR